VTSPGHAHDDRVYDWLQDLAGFGADADYLVGLGEHAYLADTQRGVCYGTRESDS